MPSHGGDQLASGVAFISAARRYWLDVFPRCRRELRGWNARASSIPDAGLREGALDADCRKRGNREGAAAFATLAPASHRAPLVRALVTFQTMYDYLDTISERPGAASPANARQLHHALVAATALDEIEDDYYALDLAPGDGGYLHDLVVTCRAACQSLPAYAAVAERARYFAGCIVSYQAMIGVDRTPLSAASSWARDYAGLQHDLHWWELAAAAGSSLPLLALFAAAADPRTRLADVMAVEHAYFPWVAAFHTLLDSLVDQSEDESAGHHSLVRHYASPEEAATRLSQLGGRSLRLVRQLPHGRRHALILFGMTSYYLVSAEGSRSHVAIARNEILAELGLAAAPARAVFAARRELRRLSLRSR